MEKLLATLNLYLDAELGFASEEAAPVDVDKPLFIDQPETDIFSSESKDDTSQES